MLLEEKEALLFKGITTLTGPNGAGKSTLLKAIVQRQKYQGKMFLAGRRLRASKIVSTHDISGATSQSSVCHVDFTRRAFVWSEHDSRKKKQEEALTF